MKNIAIVDPASYALTYDYYFIKSLSKSYNIFFYCSKTAFNYEFIEEIKSLPNVTVLEFKVSGVNKIKGIYNFIKLYFKLFLNRKSYSSINIQWSVIPLIEFFFFLSFRGKLIFTMHNSVPHNSKRKTTLFNKFASKISQYNVFVSEYTKGVFEKNYSFKSCRNIVFQHGAMPLTLKRINSTVSSEILSTQTNLREVSNMKLIFWGNIKHYKGVDFLVDNIDSLSQNDLDLEVYGKYDHKLKYLHNQILNSGHRSVNDYLPLDYVESILNQDNSLVILPYRNSSQSGIMYNCISIGKPFICSNVGESAFFLKSNNLSNLVFEFDNLSSLIDAIKYFQTNREMVESKFNDFKNSYSWEYDTKTVKYVFG